MQNQQAKAVSSIIINASIDEVWDAITNPVMVKKYFFNTDLVTDWKVGNPIYFRGEWEGKPYEDKGIVKTFEPNKTLSYTYKSSWDDSPDIPENYLLVTYELTQKEKGVEYKLTQTAKDEEQAKHSESNWDSLLIELKKLLEI